MLHEASSGAGVFIQGRAGLFAAPGGTGKSWSIAQLGVALASGATWFGPGGWAPQKPGRVLLLLAEEDEDEVQRMIYFSTRASGLLADDDLELVCTNLDAYGLAGYSVALTTDDHQTQGLPETRFAVDIREKLIAANRDERPYTAILLDPLSRFSGFDTEKDNAAATRFVQVLETFAAERCGRPSIIVACHERKQQGDNPDHDSADPVRGAKALTDGVRWVARLEQQKRQEGAADLLALRIVKRNGIPPQLYPLILCRDREHEGALRVATQGEVDSNEKVSELVKSRLQEMNDYRERVLELLRKVGGACERAEVESACGKRQKVQAAIRSLLEDRVVEKITKERKSWLRVREPQGTTSGTSSGFGASSAGSRPDRAPLGPSGGGTTAPGQLDAFENGGREPLRTEPGTSSGTTSGTTTAGADLPQPSAAFRKGRETQDSGR